ncbi:hypothetical protein BE20_30345 [Sorangium cellulosum]|nr:hypothetical protein BE20_30345 [Sorangium cellulosum]
MKWKGRPLGSSDTDASSRRSAANGLPSDMAGVSRPPGPLALQRVAAAPRLSMASVALPMNEKRPSRPAAVRRRGEEVGEGPLGVDPGEPDVPHAAARPRAPQRGRRARAGARSPPAAGFFHGDVTEVGEDLLAVLRADRLGVELHAVERPILDLEGHDEPVAARPGGHLDLGRERVAADDQRVVAHHLERAGHALEQPGAVVLDLRDLAVHRPRRVLDAPAEARREPLVAEADAEDRRVGERLDHVHADAEIGPPLGAAGAGREDDAVHRQVPDLGEREAVVPDDERLLAVHLPEVLPEDVGVRVVVVDEECLHGEAPLRARAAAESAAPPARVRRTGGGPGVTGG